MSLLLLLLLAIFFIYCKCALKDHRSEWGRSVPFSLGTFCFLHINRQHNYMQEGPFPPLKVQQGDAWVLTHDRDGHKFWITIKIYNYMFLFLMKHMLHNTHVQQEKMLGFKKMKLNQKNFIKFNLLCSRVRRIKNLKFKNCCTTLQNFHFHMFQKLKVNCSQTIPLEMNICIVHVAFISKQSCQLKIQIKLNMKMSCLF